VEQRLSLFQIERVEAFGEPAVDRSEKLAGLVPLSLIAQSRCLLFSHDRQRLPEIHFGAQTTLPIPSFVMRDILGQPTGPCSFAKAI
jgi:hypothetical protein